MAACEMYGGVSYCKLKLHSEIKELPMLDVEDTKIAQAGEVRVEATAGFWTDQIGALDRVSSRHSAGEITDDERRALEQFIVQGFAIVSGAVSDDLIDDVSASLAQMFSPENPRMMSYWDDKGHHIEQAREELMMEAEAKLLDIHYVSEGAQNAIFAPKIRRFLELVFCDAPLAFQSLYFKRGSEQGIHQDTAFVPVDGAPLEFVATWIALEDVAEGTGELLYVPTSQKLPPLQFANGRKCTASDPLLSRYEEIVRDHYSSAGLKTERFLPKKGDVLFWAADLCHGGAPITQKGSTRRSLVTHYCPLSRRPEYASHGEHPVKRTGSGGYVISQE